MAGFAGIVFDSDGFLRFLVMAVISNAALGTWALWESRAQKFAEKLRMFNSRAYVQAGRPYAYQTEVWRGESQGVMGTWQIGEWVTTTVWAEGSRWGLIRFLLIGSFSVLSPDEIQDRIVLLGLLVLSPVLFAAFLVFLFAL